MGHFSVLVIGKDVEGQLQPYHEFEYTGVSDQYVVDVDDTEEKRKEYEEHTETMCKLPDGSLQSYFDDAGQWRPEYSQVDETQGVFPAIADRRTYFTPPGCEKVKVPTPQVKSFANFLTYWTSRKAVYSLDDVDLDGEHTYGYILLDGGGDVIRCIDHTNPNAKWDWWTTGGRWSGHFKLKPGAQGLRGEPGLMGSQRNEGDGFVDVAFKRDIDIEGMRGLEADKAKERWLKYRAGIDSLWESWDSVIARYGEDKIEQARDFYHGQPQFKANEALRQAWSRDDFLAPMDEYIQRRRSGALATHAIVRDSKWMEQGTMGWFGVVVGAEDQDAWNAHFQLIWDSIPDDEVLSIVDCHI